MWWQFAVKETANGLQLGADQSIDYTKRSLSDALDLRSMDVVIDCAGGREQWLMARKVLVKGVRFVTISRDEDGPVTIGSALALISSVILRKVGSVFGDRVQYVLLFLRASSAVLDRVDALIVGRKVRVPLEQRSVFSHDAPLELIDLSKSGRMRGKSVLERKAEPLMAEE